MWGIWFLLTFGLGFGVIVLLIALVVGASPLFAVFAVLLALAVLAAVFWWRRSVEHARTTSEASEMPSPNPQSGGAPVSGEGS